MTLKRILIVDDQRDIRRLLRESVRVLGGGTEIIDVPSGEEALLVISHQRFDLLISDVRLAGMSGLELVRKVRKRNPGLKVILVTGLTDSEVRRQVSAAGVEAFFFKPVDIASLQAAVKECLGLEGDDAGWKLQEDGVSGLPEAGAGVQTEALRVDIGADCVLLVDQEGKVHQRSGSLPGNLDEGLLVSSAVAVIKAARTLASNVNGEVAERILISQGNGYLLQLVNTRGDQFFVALVRSPEPWLGREAMERAAKTMIQPPAEQIASAGRVSDDVERIQEEASLSETDLSDLDAALHNAGEASENTQELDEFWETAADQAPVVGSSDSRAISYEQAKRLGLAPVDDKG